MSEASLTNREENSMDMDQIEENMEVEDQEMGRRGHRIVLPEDGCEWKKYGQKFIKNIGKYRSYFKCQNANCRAKKRAEWCTTEPNNIRIVYDGVHTHDSSQTVADSSTSSSNANRYNLLTQVFGDPSSANQQIQGRSEAVGQNERQ